MSELREVRITNPAALAIIREIKRMRGTKTAGGTAADVIIERGVALGIDPHLLLTRPHVAPPTTANDGRAGAVHSSRPKGGRACRKSA